MQTAPDIETAKYYADQMWALDDELDLAIQEVMETRCRRSVSVRDHSGILGKVSDVGALSQWAFGRCWSNMHVDRGQRDTGRELYDPGRYVVTLLAPVLLWYFNRDPGTADTREEILKQARQWPRERLDYSAVNMMRTFAWLMVMLAPFGFMVPATFIRWDDAPDNPNPVLDVIFRGWMAIMAFGGAMMLLSAWRWGLAFHCDYQLDLLRGRSRRGRPRGRVWAWLMRRCTPSWIDTAVAVLITSTYLRS